LNKICAANYSEVVEWEELAVEDSDTAGKDSGTNQLISRLFITANFICKIWWCFKIR